MIYNVLSGLILQLGLLAAAVFAAPVANGAPTATTISDAWKYSTGGGLLGFVVLILDIMVFSA